MKRSIVFLSSLAFAAAAAGQSAQPIFDRLTKLRDVSIVTPADTEVLTYDSATSKWKNRPGGGGSSFIADTPLFLSAGHLSIQLADGTHNGYLSSSDWNLFNGKISLASLSGTSPITYDNGTGAIGLNVNVNHQFTAVQTVKILDSSTVTETIALNLAHNSTGTPGPVFGTRIEVFGASTTTLNRILGEIGFNWIDPTDASRTSRLCLRVVNPVIVEGIVLFGSSGLSLGYTTSGTAPDPGAGIVNARLGFAVGTVPLNFSHVAGSVDLGGAQASGTLAAGREPAHTGDVTNSAGSLALALVNIPDLTTQAGSILATNIAAPASPAAGKTKIYVDSTSKNLAAKNDAGVVNHGIQSRTATAKNYVRSIADDGSSTISQPTLSPDLSDVLITTPANNDVLTYETASSLWKNKPSTGTGTVTTTGSPVNGNLAKFSGATSITNGDLSGDVTTAGGLVAALVNIPDLVTQAGSILATQIAAPAAPAAGKSKLYFDSTSTNMATKNALGVVNHGVQSLTSSAGKFVNALNDAGALNAIALVDSDVPDILTLTKISNLTTNGLITTGSGDGTLSVTHFNDGTAGTGLAQYLFSQNAAVSFDVKNSNGGANAIAQLIAETDAGQADLTMFPSTYVTSGINVAGSTKLAAVNQLTIASAGGKPILFSGDGEATSGAQFWFGQTVASATSAVLDEVRVDAKTSTVTGTTAITTAKGFNKVSIYKPTFTDSSAVAITRGATLYIEDAPAVGGSLTLTNKFALTVDNGISSFHGGIRFAEAAPAAGLFPQSDGSVYTNSAYKLPAAVGAAGNSLISNGTDVVSRAEGGMASVTATVDQTAVAEQTHVTYTVPANTAAIGTTYRISAWGNIDNPVTTAIVFTPIIRWGGSAGVTLQNGPALTASTTANTNRQWSFVAMVTIRTIGATGTAFTSVDHWIERSSGVGGAPNVLETNSGATGVTIDTTANKDLVLDFTLSAITGTPHIRTIGGTVEVVKP